MTTAYHFLKAMIDPLILALSLIIIALLYLLKSGRNRTGKVFLLLAFFVLYMTGISPVANIMCYIVEKDYLLNETFVPNSLDVVVVLGGGVSENIYLEETMPSYQTASRLLHAVQVFNKSGSKYLVFMGKGAGKLSEAEVMKTSAERLGVPTASLMIDLNSRNTWEHAAELNKMFPAKDIKIGLVTSAYHMRRSEREFRKYFPNVIALPSDYLYSSPKLSIVTFMPRSGNLYKFATVLNEMTGNVWYRIRKG